MEKEIDIKHSGVRDFLASKNIEGILLSRQSNFLWFTGGKLNDVIKNNDISLVNLFITKDKKYLIATNSDADRVMAEELNGLGFELVKFDWFNQNVFDGLKKIGVKGKIGADFASDVDKKNDKYVLVGTVGEKDGICANVSRCIYFGKTPAELKERHSAVNYVISKFYANAT